MAMFYLQVKIYGSTNNNILVYITMLYPFIDMQGSLHNNILLVLYVITVKHIILFIFI